MGFGLLTMLAKAQFLNDGKYSYSDELEGGPVYLEFSISGNSLLIANFNFSSGPEEYATKAKGKWVASQTKNEVLEKKKANGKYEINFGKKIFKLEYATDKTIKLYDGITKEAFIMYKQK